MLDADSHLMELPDFLSSHADARMADRLPPVSFSSGGKLGQRLMVHPTSVTAVVDILERLGFVERVAHPTDRRQTLARITALGRTTMEQASQEIAVDDFGLGALSSAEAETLCLLLKKVRSSARLDRQGTAGAEAS